MLASSFPHRLRALLILPVLLAMVFVTQVASAPPASAAAYGTRTALISRFNNGDVAYVKVSVERMVSGIDTYGRAHVKVWCANSNGVTVVCEEVQIGTINDADLKSLSLETWTSSGWQPRSEVFLGSYAEVYPALDKYTPWDCTLSTLSGDWRTVAYNVRVQARSGQLGSFHTVPSNTAYDMGFGCPV